ncbi:nuclear migration protein nudC-like protein [Achlya hypogyna]|uniref:Nuclear migration protein nudC-like protein n=1 Tax=Achlya hypogyna TaxID=1202772 RepID=A0A1V9YPI2_ACHHY|nr:nuclear migration protein nudC-like protein [Achlya hypogyna]
METRRVYDDVFMGIVQKEGNIQGLLHAFFDFLHRNTDFYVVSENPRRKMGFAPGQAQGIVLQSFQRFPMKPLHDTPSAAVPTPAATPTAAPAATQAPATPNPAPRLTAPPVMTDDGKQVPVGNGGQTDKYSWTQSLQDLTVSLPVPKGTKSRDLSVKMAQTSLRVAINGQEPLVDGALAGKIKTEESFWSLEANETLVLSLEKAPPQTWWKTVLQGDAEIDTTKVDSTMRIDEYDPVTQGAIRKVMYEQRHGIRSGTNNLELPGPPTTEI